MWRARRARAPVGERSRDVRSTADGVWQHGSSGSARLPTRLAPIRKVTFAYGVTEYRLRMRLTLGGQFEASPHPRVTGCIGSKEGARTLFDGICMAKGGCEPMKEAVPQSASFRSRASRLILQPFTTSASAAFSGAGPDGIRVVSHLCQIACASTCSSFLWVPLHFFEAEGFRVTLS
jgi:hypothetical protein